MANFDALTYFHLQGLFNAIVGDIAGFFGDPGTEPDLYNVNTTATISYGLAASPTGKIVPGPPELRITDVTPPRTLLLLAVDVNVESGVLRVPGADAGVDGVDLVARSDVLGIDPDKLLICSVSLATATIGGHQYGFDPISFIIPTVEPADYHANEVQTVTLTGTPWGGTWEVVYDDIPTMVLPINSTPAAFQTALRGIAAIGNAVTVTGGAGGVNAVLTITVNGSPGTGTFTLQFLDQQSGPINWNATAAQVQAALVALGYIGATDVVVTGPAGGPWQATFQNSLGSAPITLITQVDATMATAGGSVAVTATTPGHNVGPYTVTFDTGMIARPLRLGKLDNMIGPAPNGVLIEDTWAPTVVDLTTVDRYVPA